MSAQRPRPVVLIVRDGWGANPHPEWNHANAVHLGKTPVDDKLMATYPHVQICTHGPEVGLPEGIMGNSEVGHQNIGAGRIVDQEVMRISRRIRDASFFDIDVLRGAFEHAEGTNGHVHIMGLCSDAGVHSVLEHLYAILEMAKRVGFDGSRVFLHAFGDGRDSPPKSGIDVIAEIEAKMAELGVGRVATVIGRFYAMDRDNRWGRVERAYRMLVDGKGHHTKSATDAFQNYYDNPSDDSRHGDEFITPTVIVDDQNKPLARIKDGDSVIFFNYRGDRPRELTKAFVYDTFPFEHNDDLHGFERDRKLDLYFATMSEFEKGLPVRVIVPKPEKMKNIFGQLIADLGMTQFRCAETEKYPHVTFFFNDYREEPFPGEDRQIIPSPRDIPTYDLKPQMSAIGVCDEVVARIESDKYDVIVVNFANGDMVGHTGSLEAAIKAVETVDTCVGRIVDATLARGGALIVTADHGNCEQMIDPRTDGPHTSHTTYDVELIGVGEPFIGRSLRSSGKLADIAPTMLDIMKISKPPEMDGQSLLS